MECLGLYRKNGTFVLVLLNKTKMIIKSYFIQFSFKKPWKYPHREERFDNGSYLYGWLFFYFGNIISK